MVELEGGHATAETGYENALWLLQAMLDDHFYDDTAIRDDDRIGIEKCRYCCKLLGTKADVQ